MCPERWTERQEEIQPLDSCSAQRATAFRSDASQALTSLRQRRAAARGGRTQERARGTSIGDSELEGWGVEPTQRWWNRGKSYRYTRI